MLHCKSKWLVARLSLALVAISALQGAAGDKDQHSLFDHKNLVAWCIVPFDSFDRSPAERAQMLKSLGFTKFAYDYRAKHIPTFDEEVQTLKEQGIELFAWWFPTTLNSEAKTILEVLKRNDVRTQLWITGGGGPTKTEAEQQARIAAEVARLRPIAEAAKEIGCSVGLYNHGGWFGEPENLVAVVNALNMPNVGIVYNLHHGHAHLERLADALAIMKPYLYCLNLNGMDVDGDKKGRKILPLGEGEKDLEVLRTIAASGYIGPIGILNHTQHNAEHRLKDNLERLDWLVKQLAGQPAGPKPKLRTPDRPAGASRTHSHHLPAAILAAAPMAMPAVPAGGAAPEYSMNLVKDLLNAAKGGNTQRGVMVFASAKYACISCHKVGEHGGIIGPELTKALANQPAEKVVESLLWPQREVKPEFAAVSIMTDSGQMYRGYKIEETEDNLVIRDVTNNQPVTIKKDSVEARREGESVMPDGLTNAMSPQEQADLIRFLLAVQSSDETERQSLAMLLAHAHSHEPVKFEYNRDPLYPEDWPSRTHPINRGRVYDFYAKQAMHFRGMNPRPALVMASPGLDDGKFGHWGNQDESTWANDAWNQVDVGSLLSGVFRADKTTVARAVCVHVGESGEFAVCFNPDTLKYEALWQGRFFNFSSVRHGFMHGLIPGGEMLSPPQLDYPQGDKVYHGFYRSGPRVVFAYRVGEVEYLDSPWVENGQFVRILAPADEHPLREVLSGGEPQWPQVLTTAIDKGSGSPYAVDTIHLPFDNPWKARVFPGGHAFLPDGSAVICTMHGDVWRVSGLDADSTQAKWRRIASGLHQAQGIVADADGIYVLGRDQITRLQDHNGDGETDFYEAFSRAYVTSTAGHDFICGLERDDQGRFYLASGNQGLVRISADGKQAEVLATGFRNPDGLGLMPDGTVTVPCSEGTWTPATTICAVRPGGKQSGVVANELIGGHDPPYYGYGGPRNGKAPDLPLVYLPRALDNSAGGQAYIDSDRWGPLRGLMVHVSYGAGSQFLLLTDEVRGQIQGAAVPFPGEFLSGAHRAGFRPQDGQLYVSGMGGWGHYTVENGCFHRVRYTGAPVLMPKAFHVHENGVMVHFTNPVDPAVASDVLQHFAQCWNYRYSGGYGSPEFAPSHMGVKGHDVLEITRAVVRNDGKSLFLEIPDIQPVSQLHLHIELAKDARPTDMFLTVHRLDEPFTELTGYRPVAKVIRPHPMVSDLTLATLSVPNPYKAEIKDARKVSVETGKNLTFAKRSFKAKPGEAIRFTLVNPDVVPHNWALLKPGTLQSVGQMANHLVSDPEAFARHYIPKTSDVIAHTDVVLPGESFTIYFKAPTEPGRYPYVCTFPGHWMVMNGEMIVEE